MGEKLATQCPACGGKGSLHKSGGTEITYYCECDECRLRTRDYKRKGAAVLSWETDDKDYFFYKKD